MLERVNVLESNSNPVFEQFRKEHIRRYEMARTLVKNWGYYRPDVRIIDAACGCGYGSGYLSDLGHYVGVDACADTIEECEQLYPESEFRLVDLNAFQTFGDQRFDIAVSFETAEHLRDPGDFFDEIYRVLNDNGLFIFSAPTSLTRDFDPYHKRDWSMRRWTSELEQSGFYIVGGERMAFTAKFTDFLHTTPTTWKQKGQIGRFLLTHPLYLLDRMVNWLFRNRFFWSSHLFCCIKKEGYTP